MTTPSFGRPSISRALVAADPAQRRAGRSAIRLGAIALLALVAACSSSDGGSSGATSGQNPGGASGGGSETGGAAGGGAIAGGSGSGGGAGRATGGAGPTSGGAAGATSGGRTSSGGVTNNGGTSSAGASGAGATSSGGVSASAGGGTSGGCIPEASACDPQHTVCCTGLICVSSTSPDYAGCRIPCTLPSDCTSGCCIPFGNIPDKGFCADATLCQCSGKDEPCGGVRQCCSGFTCTTFDATNQLGCEPLCKTNADCATNCCVAIPTTPYSACLSPSYCGR